MTVSTPGRDGVVPDRQPGRDTRGFLNRLIVFLARVAFRLRYRISVTGLDEIAAKGREKILFLPNHTALIDPVILLTILYKDFAPRSLADEYRTSHPLIRWFSNRFGASPLPSVERYGFAAAEGVRKALAKGIEDLQMSRNLLIYPSGRLKRSYREEIGAASGVETILSAVPDARVVLIRNNGLWGSSFSWAATGRSPDSRTSLKRVIKYLFLNGLFFMPRRIIEIEFFEPKHFPRGAGRLVMNRFLEEFYNAKAWPNTYVPYFLWEKSKSQERLDPEEVKIQGDVSAVSKDTARRVVQYIEVMTGTKGIQIGDSLPYDLGLDSLALMEVILWIEEEFGAPEIDPDSLRTVRDVMLAAEGRKAPPASTPLKPLSSRWFETTAANKPLKVEEGSRITEVFLHQARRNPTKVIIADPLSGEKTYRDIVTAVIALKPHLERLPGNYLGIMLPASVGASIFFLAALFAGKIPVMINFTSGPRDRDYLLDLLEVRLVLTSKAFIDRLEIHGTDMSRMRNRFSFVEDLGKKIGWISRMKAYLMGLLSWSSLETAKVAGTAVILFTSGSESLPKAVPLSHGNILANIRDLPSRVTLRENDVMIGILPPFHSFGLTGTVVLPLCMGLRTVYYPNPNEAAALARLIKFYRVSLLVGTPRFLGNIARAARADELQTLRLAVSGAEKCPDWIYRLLEERRPPIKVLEGYGATECSPIISLNEENDPSPFTIGRIMPSLEHALIDPERGGGVDRGRMGLFLVRGPSVFEGYLKYEGPSPFVDYRGKQWYGTGDLIKEDEGGVLTFCGRLKRFIKRGGEMISLPSIESVLESHFLSKSDDRPAIAVESTPGFENPELVLFTTSEADLATVNRIIRDAGLSSLHHISRIVKLDEIPVLGTGKSDYRMLRELLHKAER